MTMAYEINEVAEMIKIYNNLESKIKDFLFISAAALKNKEHKIKSAEALLIAIQDYKKLPIKIRDELEKDEKLNVHKLVELEKLCREALNLK